MTYLNQNPAIQYQPSVAISPSANEIYSSRKESIDSILKQTLFYNEELRKEFDENKKKWLDDTKFKSNPIEITSHPSFLHIIDMGQNVLYFIFEDLKTNLNHWFVALEKITGENPVSPEDYGDIQKMASVWLDLAERNLWYLK